MFFIIFFERFLDLCNVWWCKYCSTLCNNFRFNSQLISWTRLWESSILATSDAIYVVFKWKGWTKTQIYARTLQWPDGYVRVSSTIFNPVHLWRAFWFITMDFSFNSNHIGGGRTHFHQHWRLVVATRHYILKVYSWAGRRGYRAPPGNQFLIDFSRLEKYHRKRFAMLKSWQNVPHTIFMQISDAITGNVYFAISQLIVHIAQQLRCLAPCFEGPRAF